MLSSANNILSQTEIKTSGKYLDMMWEVYLRLNNSVMISMYDNIVMRDKIENLEMWNWSYQKLNRSKEKYSEHKSNLFSRNSKFDSDFFN